MFWVAFLNLLLIAGFVHRAHHPEATRLEIQIMGYGLLVLWPLIVLETWAAFFIRDRAVRPRRSTMARAVWITFVPPLRMGMPCPFTGQLWLPRWGWCERGKLLEDRLDRAFHKPMLVFAILILPVLALEFTRVADVRSSPSLALTLHLSVAVIWVAFAVEFAVKVSAARRPFRYCKERWLDLAIVILPLLEFLLTYLANAALLSRLLRVARAAGPEQIARMGQIYRLRGLLTKGWRAILVLQLVAKLTGNSPQKQLRKLEEQIAETELALAELKAQAEVLRNQCRPAEPEKPAEEGVTVRASSGEQVRT
jgi:voltage-gated potassium channel